MPVFFEFPCLSLENSRPVTTFAWKVWTWQVRQGSDICHSAEGARSAPAELRYSREALETLPRTYSEGVTVIEGHIVLFLITGHTVPLGTLKATYTA